MIGGAPVPFWFKLGPPTADRRCEEVGGPSLAVCPIQPSAESPASMSFSGERPRRTATADAIDGKHRLGKIIELPRRAQFFAIPPRARDNLSEFSLPCEGI